jgi:hypothetical protein
MGYVSVQLRYVIGGLVGSLYVGLARANQWCDSEGKPSIRIQVRQIELEEAGETDICSGPTLKRTPPFSTPYNVAPMSPTRPYFEPSEEELDHQNDPSRKRSSRGIFSITVADVTDIPF